MARFFVGGVAEISDVSYIAKPQGFEVGSPGTRRELITIGTF